MPRSKRNIKWPQKIGRGESIKRIRGVVASWNIKEEGTEHCQQQQQQKYGTYPTILDNNSLPPKWGSCIRNSLGDVGEIFRCTTTFSQNCCCCWWWYGSGGRFDSGGRNSCLTLSRSSGWQGLYGGKSRNEQRRKRSHSDEDADGCSTECSHGI